MDIFDLIGPIMVGPSSSHTAGAVRIGLACRRILGEEIAEADITLSGSFAATGRGHGTDKAIVAGLWDRGRFLVPLFALYPLHLATVVFGTPVIRAA